MQASNPGHRKPQYSTIIANKLQGLESKPNYRANYSGGKGIDKSNAGNSRGVANFVDAQCEIRRIQDLYKMTENAKPSPHNEISLKVLEICDTRILGPDLGRGSDSKTKLSKSCGVKHLKKNECVRKVNGGDLNPFRSSGRNIGTMYRNKSRMKRDLKESNSLFLGCDMVDGTSSEHVTVGIPNGRLQDNQSDSSLYQASVNAKLMSEHVAQSRSEPKLNTISESSLPTMNTKSRKRKRIIIKNRDTSEKCEKVASRVDIEKDNERSGKKRRVLNSYLIDSLDGYI